MTSLVSELRRRNVLRVAAAYALVSWILIEAGSVLLPTFGAPEWFFRAYVVLVLFGFVLAMIIAWVFEITPDGVRRERDIDRTSYQPRSRGKMNLVIIALLVLALGVSVTFNVTGIRKGELPAQPIARDSIAVLPFENRSTDEENRYFADGIHDDILTRLADIESLRVISRTSVNEYRDTSKNIRQIGRELGVATVVEGAVQRSGDQVRITVQLIDATTDEHIWASTFNKEMTIQNVFDVQSEISAHIASSLQAALTPEEEMRMAAAPTNNIAAYAEYVKGRRNLSTRNFSSLQEARQNFVNAIELDPNYAQAHAALAQTLLVTLSNHKSISASDAFSMSAGAIERALEIDPGLADAYAVRGLLQMMRWEMTRTGSGNIDAANSFQKAIELSPSQADTYVWFSSLRTSEGQVNSAIDLLTKALSIDPLSRIPYVNLPSFYAMRGQNAETTRMLLQAISLFPEWSTPYNYLSNHMQKLGRLDESIAWGLKEMALSEDPMAGGQLISIYKNFGQDDAVMTFMENFPQDHPLYPVGKSYWHYITRDYEGTIRELEGISDQTDLPRDFAYPLMVGASVMSGDYDRAYNYISRADPALTRDSDISVDRKNFQTAVLLAFVEQKRNRPGHAEELLKKAQPVVQSLPRLGMAGHGIKDVHILTLQGRFNAAIEALLTAVDEGFVTSEGFDAWAFDEDPIIEPLRRDPRFPAIERRMNERVDVLRRNVEKAQETNDWSGLIAMSETV
ncbi:MAG: tetratricopeptide repeat protein [Woeseiaceae bacterium]